MIYRLNQVSSTFLDKADTYFPRAMSWRVSSLNRVNRGLLPSNLPGRWVSVPKGARLRFIRTRENTSAIHSEESPAPESDEYRLKGRLPPPAVSRRSKVAWPVEAVAWLFAPAVVRTSITAEPDDIAS
jgi:hypothetical protein